LRFHNNKVNGIINDGNYIHSDNVIDGNKVVNNIENLEINKEVKKKIEDLNIKEKKEFNFLIILLKSYHSSPTIHNTLPCCIFL